MSHEEIYQATKQVCAEYAAFFHEVARALGEEPALALHQRAHERLGMTAARVLENPCRQPFDLDGLQRLLLAGNRSLGMDSEVVEAAPGRVVLRNGRCPRFDGYWMGGVDDGTARRLCERGTAARLDALLTELNPHLEHRVGCYRASPEEACLEEVTLRQAAPCGPDGPGRDGVKRAGRP